MCEFSRVIKELSAFRPEQGKKRVGNYVLGRVIGEGAFAKVRIGLHCISGEKVAIKVVNKRAVAKKDYLQKNMRREAMLLQQLDHPNICRLFETMETANSYYLVMELAEGGDLMRHLNKKKVLSELEARRYMRQLVSAVDHMHSIGVVHRDLKIDNLLLDCNYNLKIIDFGLSTAFDEASHLSTQCGSIAYAAPEILGRQSYGHAVDIWSIGVNLFAILTGALPFKVESNNLTKLHAAILRGPRIPPTLSRDCQDLLRKLLEPAELKRITIKDIMAHPWINVGFERAPKSSYSAKKRSPDDVDPRIVRYIAHKCGIPESEIRNAVLKDKLNGIGGTYNIFVHRQSRGIVVPLTENHRPSTDRVAFKPTLDEVKQESIVPIPNLSDNNAASHSNKQSRCGARVNTLPGVKDMTHIKDITQNTKLTSPLPRLENYENNEMEETKILVTKSCPSETYRDCIKQLKERSQAKKRGILKLNSAKSSLSSHVRYEDTNSESSHQSMSVDGIGQGDNSFKKRLKARENSHKIDDPRNNNRGVHFTMTSGEPTKLDHKYLLTRLSTAPTTVSERYYNRLVHDLPLRSKTDLVSLSPKGSLKLIKTVDHRERRKAQKIMAQMNSSQPAPPPPPPNSALGIDYDITDTRGSTVTDASSHGSSGDRIIHTSGGEKQASNYKLKINIRLPAATLMSDRSRSMPEFAVRKLGKVIHANMAHENASKQDPAMSYLACDYDNLPWRTDGPFRRNYLYENKIP